MIHFPSAFVAAQFQALLHLTDYTAISFGSNINATMTPRSFQIPFFAVSNAGDLLGPPCCCGGGVTRFCPCGLPSGSKFCCYSNFMQPIYWNKLFLGAYQSNHSYNGINEHIIIGLL